MDRRQLERCLAQAGRHIARDFKRVERQRALVDKMLIDGCLTRSALELLNQLEKALAHDIADRDRFRSELNVFKGKR